MLKVNKDLSVSNGSFIGGLWVTIHYEIEALEVPWRALQAIGFATIFQSFDWCKTWIETCGAQRGLKPLFVVARRADHETAFILPFQIRSRLGCNVLEWLGQPQFNYGAGIYSTAVLKGKWFKEYGYTTIHTVPDVTVFNLRNMANDILDRPGPISGFHGSQAANSSYLLRLTKDFHELHSLKRSAKSLSKIRRRDERLHELGDLRFERLSGDIAKRAIADGLAHKNIQLKKAGVRGLFDKADMDFYKALPDGIVDAFRLTLNDETLSTNIGAMLGGRFYLIISSLGSETAQHLSPGNYLLRRTIEHYCAADCLVYDFGNGEQAYKLLWADQEVFLYNYIATKNIRGLGLAFILRLSEHVKRRIKTTAMVQNFVFTVRETLFGR